MEGVGTEVNVSDSSFVKVSLGRRQAVQLNLGEQQVDIPYHGRVPLATFLCPLILFSSSIEPLLQPLTRDLSTRNFILADRFSSPIFAQADLRAATVITIPSYSWWNIPHILLRRYQADASLYVTSGGDTNM